MPQSTRCGTCGAEFEITQAQYDALNRKFIQDPDGAANFHEFRSRAIIGFMGEYIMIPWCGMWLGIEKDGYTHS